MPDTQIVKDCDTMIALYRQPVQMNGILESIRKDPRVDPAPVRKHTPCIKSCDYLSLYLDSDLFNDRIGMAVNALRTRIDEFDSIAFRGMSGALIAPPVARALGKSLIMVRKYLEDCHSHRLVEGDVNTRYYVIVDDLVSSGNTQRAIREAVARDNFAPDALCIGVLEVNHLHWRSPEWDGRCKLTYNNPSNPNQYRMGEE